MNSCSAHRDHLSALADGERDLVRPGTIAHVGECEECAREVATQRRLTRLLLGAAGPPMNESPVPRRSRMGRRSGAVAMSIVLTATVLSGTLGWRALERQDQVSAAVSVAGQPPQLRSADGAQIEAWCEREAERAVPEISNGELEPVGARMDRSGGDEIVTVTYLTHQHRSIRVSWIDGGSGARSVETRSVSGSTVLVVASGAGTAVLSGDAPLSTLWEAAARIQAIA